MQNVGEEIAGEYLRVVKGCEFVTYNVSNPDIQGEIDVIGIELEAKRIYVCEVAIHLPTGLQYVKNGRPDNVARLVRKFGKDIEYAEKYFSDYKKFFMLWCPIVKNQRPGSKYNQVKDVELIQETIKSEHGYQIETIINHQYQLCLKELRRYARGQTSELKSRVLRLMQIEERLTNHLEKLQE